MTVEEHTAEIFLGGAPPIFWRLSLSMAKRMRNCVAKACVAHNSLQNDCLLTTRGHLDRRKMLNFSPKLITLSVAKAVDAEVVTFFRHRNHNATWPQQSIHVCPFHDRFDFINAEAAIFDNSLSCSLSNSTVACMHGTLCSSCCFVGGGYASLLSRSLE